MLLKRLGQFILDILEVVVFATAIFLFVYLLLLQPHKIKGASMEPNFQNGEYLLTDKVSYRLHEPERGDVIVFKAPVSNGDEYIKRIIGLPGEKIVMISGQVYINSTKLNEIYLPESYRTYQIGNFLKEGQETYVPEGKYFVLGDNRMFSSDSRSWGFIDRKDITGKAWLIYWPISKMGIIANASYSI